MRFAYADPPYLGLGKYYVEHHPDALAWDRVETHAELIRQLVDGFDGWALSLHEPSLRTILPLTPEGVRVMPWVKPFASFKPGISPAYTWEPVIVSLPKRKHGRDAPTVRDHVSCVITLRRGLVGAKPDGFCFWLFDVLNIGPNDEFVDLFPGSGAVTTALDSWRRQKRFA